MSNIFIIMKKELKRFFTDKRMLLSLFLPGIILYLVYSLMGNALGGMLSVGEGYKYKIGINVESEYYTDGVFSVLEQSGEIDFEKVVEKDEIKAMAMLESGEVDIFVKYKKGADGKLDEFQVFFNSVSPESTTIYATFAPMLSSMSATPIFSVVPTDTATAEDSSMMIIGMMLPFLMVTFLFSSCMAVATESIAGEKERGTIATLLVTPVKRSHIALGKVAALSVTALASAVVSFIAVITSLPNLMESTAGTGVEIALDLGALEYLSLFAVIVLTVMLFTVLLSIISTIAKSVKEASAYAIPLMVVVMVVGVSGLMGIDFSNPLFCLIPVYNSIACMSAVFAGSLNPLALLCMVVSNIALIALGVFVLAKLFSNENVMFGK
ncbi:MAG: ABC transporter permease [Clostridia bacterium]|nr:ABC transporter permease [Clostridia bacterium]